MIADPRQSAAHTIAANTSRHGKRPAFGPIAPMPGITRTPAAHPQSLPKVPLTFAAFLSPTRRGTTTTGCRRLFNADALDGRVWADTADRCQANERVIIAAGRTSMAPLLQAVRPDDHPGRGQR
jgi:hypothetical protein